MKSHHCNQPNTSTRIQSLHVSISQCRKKNVAWILEYELSYIRVIVVLAFGFSRFKFPAIMKLWKITYREDKQTGSSCLTPADKLGKYSSFICYPFTALHKKTQKHWVFRSGFMWYWHIQWSSTCTMHMPCYKSQAHYHLTHTIRCSYTCATGTDFSKNLNFSLSLSFHQCSKLSVPIKAWKFNPVTSTDIPTQTHATCHGHCKYTHQKNVMDHSS